MAWEEKGSPKLPGALSSWCIFPLYFLYLYVFYLYFLYLTGGKLSQARQRIECLVSAAGWCRHGGLALVPATCERAWTNR